MLSTDPSNGSVGHRDIVASSSDAYCVERYNKPEKRDESHARTLSHVAQECAEYVRDVRSKGFDAYVTETTLWENLNDEPWYVVTIGVYSSQDEANAALPRVQNELDGTAYTKYSGLYVG